MEYYLKLFQLFLKSNGVKMKDSNFDKFKYYERHKAEFIEWLKQYKLCTYEYKKYLENYIGISLDNERLIELGKGNIDSIVGDNSIVVSPYAHTFNDLYRSNSTIVFDDDNVYFNMNDENILIDRADMIMCNNPYMYHVMSTLEKLYNRDYNIMVGVYGKEYDKNKIAKIKILKEFLRNKDRLEYHYNTSDDNYFYVLTKKKIQ